MALFCLGLIYALVLIVSALRLFKFPSFSSDARIAKAFYIFIFVVCLMRTLSFFSLSLLFNEAYNYKENEMDYSVFGTEKIVLESDDGKFASINKSPHLMVLLFLIPEYCVVFAYLIISWQLLSLYYDGHAQIFQSMWVGCGIYFIASMGIIFVISLSTFVLLYLNNMVKAQVFAIQLITLNWACPAIMFIIVIYFAFKFSGSPFKSPEYSSKIR